MKNPTISVIMPTYNHADFVNQSIQSVIQQSGVNFEFLIMDDGSSDNTREIVQSFKDKRIKFYPNEVNRGACSVTNDLINLSKGEFIALINSDDCWIDKNKLACQLKILKSDNEIGACFGKARFIDTNDSVIDKKTLPFGRVFDQSNKSQGKWLRHFFDFGNCICHPTMLIRKSCYEKLGLYNNRLRQLPDFEMWIRLVKYHKIFISDKDLINFRILPGENASSPSHINSNRTINEHLLIAKNFFDDINRKLIIDGFNDLLIQKSVPSDKHLEIEKTLLFFINNQWLGKAYKMIGLLKLYNLLQDNLYRSILERDYEINDLWFQTQMGAINVLSPDIIMLRSKVKNLIYKAWSRLSKK